MPLSKAKNSQIQACGRKYKLAIIDCNGEFLSMKHLIKVVATIYQVTYCILYFFLIHSLSYIELITKVIWLP